MADGTTRQTLPTTMHSAASKNDDLIELLVLKRKLAKMLDKCDSMRDFKALSLEYRETLKDIRDLGAAPTDEETATDRAKKGAEDFLNT